MVKEKEKITDLRSALALLRTIPGQLIETDEPADPHAEISGVYRYVGAGGTVQRPTQTGPAMIFNNVKGNEDARVLIGLLASRERVALMLGAEPQRLGFLLNEAVTHPIEPITIEQTEALCQEVVHYANERGFDIRKLLPAPTNTEEDAGPYITLGMCYASDPETGESDVTIHRLCLQSKDEISMYIVPGARHLGVFHEKAEKAGKPLPISISIGVDPAIEIAACFEPPTTPLGYNELSAAGAIRNRAVELVQCLTMNEKAIANAEYVIEGELLYDVRVREDQNTNTGKAMPEFPGYTGPANPQLPIIKVKAVTHRRNPIMQTCIGPSEEHVNMAGIPTEASIIKMVEKAMPGRLINVYAHSAGGGKYMAVLQFKKSVPSDEGRQRQAALLAFAAFSELKHIIIVDEDVDPFDSNDVLWALNTRYQGDVDTIFIPGVRCHPLDPSQSPEYNPLLHGKGISCKVIFDCTVPFHLKEHFKRSKFKEMNPARFAPELFDKGLYVDGRN
ncbi:UbiD family decarboxylase [Petroclostridium sp. X23]|uniref:UbiD family decarboxylase n=1 Tax=Petroclostridium sp. X23 TaxID=3045146 RepID=UPI0024AD33E6|nr:UbiD family decarboxylase [Petroclostridium sp. X23]WHH60810.1 UbiD family decarboxylase [Petroclostridium sp. X23]